MGEPARGLDAGTDRRGPSPGLTRRMWLWGGTLGLLLGLPSYLRAQPARKATLTPDEEKLVAAVRERGKKAGQDPFEVRWTEHLLGVGDAPPREYLIPALNLCETFAREFLDHFRERGFTLKFPAHRMTVVALKDPDSYQAYSGGPRNAAVGGHYDLDLNQLVVFDFRPGQEGLNAEAKRVNTFTLVHETAHLLCYNTGLLAVGRDIPVAVSEGLATYAELWSPPRDRTAFGRVNHPRLVALEVSGAEWIPLSRLLSDDRVFDDGKTADMAYAEAWLLAHYLLRRPEMLPKFRAYLGGFPEPGGKVGREAYAEKALGSLRHLDEELRRYAPRVRARKR